MSAQANKKTAIGSATASVLTIAPDSDKRINFWREQLEQFTNEIIKLRCLSSLLNGQPISSDINLNELCYLIDPSVERLSDLCEELFEVFKNSHMAFLQADASQSNSEGDQDDQ